MGQKVKLTLVFSGAQRQEFRRPAVLTPRQTASSVLAHPRIDRSGGRCRSTITDVTICESRPRRDVSHVGEMATPVVSQLRPRFDKRHEVTDNIDEMPVEVRLVPDRRPVILLRSSALSPSATSSVTPAQTHLPKLTGRWWLRALNGHQLLPTVDRTSAAPSPDRSI